MSIASQCTFYVREFHRAEGGYTYTQLSPTTPMGSAMRMQHPPQIGDMVTLYDKRCPDICYRVVDRNLVCPSYGSPAWPYGQREPAEGLMIDYIVEATVGPFRDALPDKEDDEEERE